MLAPATHLVEVSVTASLFVASDTTDAQLVDISGLHGKLPHTQRS